MKLKKLFPSILGALTLIYTVTSFAGGPSGPTRDLISQESVTVGENMSFLCGNIHGGQTVAITVRPDKGVVEVGSQKMDIKLELSVNTYRWSNSATVEKDFDIQGENASSVNLRLQVALQPNFSNDKITPSVILPKREGYNAVIGKQQYQCTKIFGHPDGVFLL